MRGLNSNGKKINFRKKKKTIIAEHISGCQRLGPGEDCLQRGMREFLD